MSNPLETNMRHVPVLLQSILESLNIDSLRDQKQLPVIVDCNLGDGGHSEEIISALRGRVHLVGFDLDADAIARATENIGRRVKEEKSKDKSFSEPKLTFVNDNFRTLRNRMIEHGIDKADGILFDLGISSYEIEESGRGFSFQKDEPLQMTFGNPAGYQFTAYEIVNEWDEENIADIIFAYGEEKYSRRIAKAIVAKREEKPIERTKELADLIRGAYPGFARNGRLHPATRTFQALRIAVNDELSSISDAVPQAVSMLREGGRISVISFHSLEDRIIKNFFKESSEAGEIRILTKRPLVPDEDEVKVNPRSRSSKLRIAEKI